MHAKTVRILLALPFLIALANIARADSLLPGQLISLGGTNLAAQPELAGTVIADVLRPFSFVDAGVRPIAGEIQDRVVREAGTGTLDFYTRVIVDSGSTGVVDDIIRTNFAGFTSDVNYRTDSIGTFNPGTAARDFDPTGNAVAFSFLSTTLLTGGDDSVFFFIKTDAVNFDANGTIDIAGETADDFIQGFEPTSVPEPASLALMGSFSVILGIFMRRKWGTQQVS